MRVLLTTVAAALALTVLFYVPPLLKLWVTKAQGIAIDHELKRSRVIGEIAR